MKTINETFTDKEFAELRRAKFKMKNKELIKKLRQELYEFEDLSDDNIAWIKLPSFELERILTRFENEQH